MRDERVVCSLDKIIYVLLGINNRHGKHKHNAEISKDVLDMH